MSPKDFAPQFQVTFAQQFHKNRTPDLTTQIGPWIPYPSSQSNQINSLKQANRIHVSLPLKKGGLKNKSESKNIHSCLKRSIKSEASSYSSKRLPPLSIFSRPQVVEICSLDQIERKQSLQFPFIPKNRQRDICILKHINKKKEAVKEKRLYFFREVNPLVNNSLRKQHESILNIGRKNNSFVMPIQVKF